MIQRSIRVSQLFLLSVLGSWLAVTAACNNDKRDATTSPEIVHDVVVLQIRKTLVPDYIQANGTVRAAQSAQLASQVMGVITRVNVREGDQVRRGEVLISLDAAQQRSAYNSAAAGLSASQQSFAAADADYVLAEATMKRYQALYDKKSVSPQEYDEVRTRLAGAKARRDAAFAGQVQAEAAVSGANTAAGFTRIRAPFDGLVVAKLADNGAVAAPGVPLLAIEGPTLFRLEATVSESQIAAVHLGEIVPVLIDSLGDQPISGKVVQIVPAADPASRTFTVKIDLATNSRVRSGLFGHACFAGGERESILVPANALLRRGQLDGVYVVGKDRIASLRYVTLGRTSASQIEVLSGLENGERVVAQPGERELSGKQIGAK